jgi:hypothetical protein
MAVPATKLHNGREAFSDQPAVERDSIGSRSVRSAVPIGMIECKKGAFCFPAADASTTVSSYDLIEHTITVSLVVGM